MCFTVKQAVYRAAEVFLLLPNRWHAQCSPGQGRPLAAAGGRGEGTPCPLYCNHGDILAPKQKAGAWAHSLSGLAGWHSCQKVKQQKEGMRSGMKRQAFAWGCTARTRVHTRTYTYIRTHAHAHTHAYIPAPLYVAHTVTGSLSCNDAWAALARPGATQGTPRYNLGAVPINDMSCFGLDRATISVQHRVSGTACTRGTCAQAGRFRGARACGPLCPIVATINHCTNGAGKTGKYRLPVTPRVLSSVTQSKHWPQAGSCACFSDGSLRFAVLPGPAL